MIVDIAAGLAPAPVDMSALNLPAGVTATFNPNPVTTVPSTTTMTVNVGGAVPIGTYGVTVQGTNGTVTSTNGATINVAGSAPAAPTLSLPANGATAQSVTPTFQWISTGAGDQYLLEVDDAMDFATPVYTATVTGLSHTVATPLNLGTTYYWRVTASNTCGVGTASAPFSFETAVAFACQPGTTEISVYETDFEDGGASWSSEGTGNSWAITTTANSGVNAFHAVDPATLSDQRLVSPPMILSSTAISVGLDFMNRQAFETPNSDGRCWDAGILEVTTDGGTTWQYVDNSHMLADPYDNVIWNDNAGNNPIAGELGAVMAWCDPAQDWMSASVDLSSWAGNTVQLRWRLGSDSAAGNDGWWIDDVSVVACEPPPPMPAIVVTKTVGTDATSCATSSNLTVGQSSTTVYYCYTVENTGNITLPLHTVVDSHLGMLLDGSTVDLGPGQTYWFTSSAVITQSTTNVVTWTASLTTTIFATATDSATVLESPTDVAFSGIQNSGNVAQLFGWLVGMASLIVGAMWLLRRRNLQ